MTFCVLCVHYHTSFLNTLTNRRIYKSAVKACTQFPTEISKRSGNMAKYHAEFIFWDEKDFQVEVEAFFNEYLDGELIHGDSEVSLSSGVRLSDVGESSGTGFASQRHWNTKTLSHSAEATKKRLEALFPGVTELDLAKISANIKELYEYLARGKRVIESDN